MKKLHPRSFWLFLLGRRAGSSLFVWFFILVYLKVTLTDVFETFGGSTYEATLGLFVGLWWLWLLLIIISYILFAYFTYHFWRFELRENEYRAERGIVWKRYVSIPYGRIQNVDIHRGLIARILGLSDILIHTAGYGGVGSRGVGSEGRLPGLDKVEAESIRDELLEKARKSGNPGI